MELLTGCRTICCNYDVVSEAWQLLLSRDAQPEESMAILASLLVLAAGVPSTEDAWSDTARAKIVMGAPRDGLLLHYSFDRDTIGKLMDSSGHHRHGSVHGRTRYVRGVRGKGLDLTGAGTTGRGGGHALLPFIDFSSLNEFTVALWVEERGISYAHGEAYVVFGADRGVTYDGSICIGHFHEDVHFRVGGGFVSVPFAKTDRGRWVHYALVFRGGRIRAYKDAGLVAEGPAKVAVSGKQAALGRHWWHGGGATSTRFLGTLDDVRVYDRGLSERELRILQQSIRSRTND